MIITEEKVNMGYQKEFSALKALAIFFMISVHIYEELSAADLSALCVAPFDVAIQFLGGPMAAPVFMFSLGIGLAYSRHREPEAFIKRGIKMLIFSYLYNVVRFTIPCAINMFSIGFDAEPLIYETFHIDILTFAAWTFILTGILKKANVPVIGVAAIAIAMQAIGLVISSNISFDSLFSVYFFGPFVSTGEPSYFPLFLWYIYPALGLVFAKYLRHISDTDKLYAGIFIVSLTVLAAFSVTMNCIGYDIRNLFALTDDIYYQQTFLHVFFSICCIFFMLSVIHYIQRLIHLKKLEKAFDFLSSNLNNIYIVQWMIIGWLSFLVFYDEGMPVAYIIPVAIVILGISCYAVSLYQKITGRKNML